MDQLGDRIRKLRIKLNLEQKELAKILNVHKGTVSNWENNNRNPDNEMLLKIASYFKVTTDYLLCGTNGIKNNHINKINRSNSIRRYVKIKDNTGSAELQELIEKCKNLSTPQIKLLIQLINEMTLKDNK